MLADAFCIIKRRSRVLRFDSRSVHELGHSITLPRLDDRCSDKDLQRHFSSEECCKKTWNWRTSYTLADTPLMVAVPDRSGSAATEKMDSKDDDIKALISRKEEP